MVLICPCASMKRCNRAMRFLKKRGLVKSLFGEDVANRMEPVVKPATMTKLRLWKDRAKQRIAERKLAEPARCAFRRC